MKKMIIAAFAIAAMCVSCQTTTPIAVTSNPIGNKCGEASATIYLGIFGGSANIGINAAAKNGGITKVSHVDFAVKDFGVIKTMTTRVYGE